MAAHASQDISAILSASGLQAYLEACRKQEMTDYDALHEAAVRLRKGIEKAGNGRWWAAGLDLKWVARKITRPMEHAADLHQEAAKALRVSWEIYLGTLGAPQDGKVGAGTFDPTK
jgi:hypothetical protein